MPVGPGRARRRRGVGSAADDGDEVGIVGTVKLVVVAERAGVPPSALTLLMAPTASVAGGVQIAARVVETALHKLHELDFEVRRAVAGIGSCPLPPVAGDDMAAIGRTNDAVLYGGQVHLTVEADDDDALRELVERHPASASSDYGEPFGKVL